MTELKFLYHWTNKHNAFAHSALLTLTRSTQHGHHRSTQHQAIIWRSVELMLVWTNFSEIWIENKYGTCTVWWLQFAACLVKTICFTVITVTHNSKPRQIVLLCRFLEINDHSSWANETVLLLTVVTAVRYKAHHFSMVIKCKISGWMATAEINIEFKGIKVVVLFLLYTIKIIHPIITMSQLIPSFCFLSSSFFLALLFFLLLIPFCHECVSGASFTNMG